MTCHHQHVKQPKSAEAAREKAELRALEIQQDVEKQEQQQELVRAASAEPPVDVESK